MMVRVKCETRTVIIVEYFLKRGQGERPGGVVGGNSDIGYQIEPLWGWGGGGVTLVDVKKWDKLSTFLKSYIENEFLS